MSERARTISIWDPGIVRQAVVDSFWKLDPRIQIKNPVMFIVEVGSLLTTIVFVQELAAGAGHPLFTGQVAVLAVVHGAVRELRRGDGRRPRQGAGRHAAQDADRDRRAPADGCRAASRQRAGGEPRARATSSWSQRRRVHSRRRRDHRGRRVGRRVGDHRRIGAGHPRVGRRPFGRHRRHARASPTGSRCASRRIPAHTFLDRMIALVEGAERQKTPNEIALNILLAVLTLVFLLVVVTLQPFAYYAGTEIPIPVLIALLVCLIPTTIGALISAIGIAGMDRLVQHNVLAMSGPRGRSGRRRRHAAARQDRDDHARQPPGDRVRAGARRQRGRAGRRGAAGVARRRDAGRPVDRRARQGEVRDPRARARRTRGGVRAVHRADADVGRRSGRPRDPQGRGRRDSSVRARQRRNASRRAAGDRRAHRPRGRHAAGGRRTHAARLASCT